MFACYCCIQWIWLLRSEQREQRESCLHLDESIKYIGHLQPLDEHSREKTVCASARTLGDEFCNSLLKTMVTKLNYLAACGAIFA
jgi:hypothetical protein